MKMDLTDNELVALIKESRKRGARKNAGTWNLEEEEEERVRARQEQISAQGEVDGGASSDSLGRMGSMQIRKASLRGINRSKMKARPLAMFRPPRSVQSPS